MITGEFPDRANKRIHIIRIKAGDNKELTLIRAIKYAVKQLRISYNLIKISKNIDVVLNDLEFLICGGGTLFEEIKAELKGNGSYDKVTLTGWIPHEKLPDYFNKMKLIVVPSYTETIPYVILEAMACGTPVVASPVAAIPDLIKDGENGLLVPPKDSNAFADAIIYLLENEDVREKMGKNGRRKVEDYSWGELQRRQRRFIWA